MSQGFERPVAPPEEAPRVSVGAATFFTFFAFVLFVLVWAWPEDAAWWSPEVSTLCAWLAVAIHVGFARKGLSAFDPRLWIPVCMLCFYFGMPVAIGLFDVPALEIKGYDAHDIGPPPELERGFAVALLTLVAFLAGSHLAGFRSSIRSRIGPHDERDRMLLGPGVCLMAGGVLMAALGVVVVGPKLLFGAYYQMMEARQFGAADFRLWGIGLAFAKGGVFAALAAHDPRRPFWTQVALGVGALCFFAEMLAGSRGDMAGFGLAAGFVFSQRVRHIPRWPVVIAFLVAFLFMPMIKEYRQLRRLQHTRSVSAGELMATTFYEMGNSVTPFTYTIHHIPRDKNYDFGGSILYAILWAIPNPTPTVGKSFSGDPIEHGPSKWYSWVANPSKYLYHGGGYGYALGAEWYFNFGFPGVLLGMIFTGWGVSKIVNRSRASGLSLVASALVLQSMVVLVRNNLGNPLKQASWPLIGLVVLRWAWPFRRPAPAVEHALSSPPVRVE